MPSFVVVICIVPSLSHPPSHVTSLVLASLAHATIDATISSGLSRRTPPPKLYRGASALAQAGRQLLLHRMCSSSRSPRRPSWSLRQRFGSSGLLRCRCSSLNSLRSFPCHLYFVAAALAQAGRPLLSHRRSSSVGHPRRLPGPLALRALAREGKQVSLFPLAAGLLVLATSLLRHHSP